MSLLALRKTMRCSICVGRDRSPDTKPFRMGPELVAVAGKIKWNIEPLASGISLGLLQAVRSSTAALF